jgi:Glycosyl hydrolase family 115/Gylcosyl hydrolase family 115 C-terminal domain/S-layer like family, C-terminal region/Glycosyl hydrolase family 67 N-terminus
MKLFLTIVFFTFLQLNSVAQSIIAEKNSATSFFLDNTTICVDTDDYAVIQIAAGLLQKDIESVTGKKPLLSANVTSSAKNIIIIGSIENSSLVKQLIQQKKINTSSLKGKWEGYQIQTISNPYKGIDNAIVITGSDRRGTAYGVFELSKQIGVSPWYWWADVPVKTKKELYFKKGIIINDAPKVKYRGIFINDEAPALSNWSKEKFGGFNHTFYEKVFELMLRLKSNYLWPAMWGNAFYYDDSLNIKSADDYAIVIGTSHHEPLMRAHEEWKYFGKGRKWNYDSTEAGLKEFWRGGMQRATNEKIVSVGMRGDGDEPMSRQTATTLLERIVKDQRQIIEEVTGKPAAATPQLWALYKEVQDYYDKGMRVPDDVTLLLCDDNWGNIRKLPKLDEKPRKGGYGIYYHFDYVGGPRNYKWVNTNPIPRVWEQMHLAYEYNVKNIWIVNVGDIKPMEFPISFFLNYAWNPEKIGADDLQKYTEQWAAAQFGSKYAKEIADIIAKYGKYNGRRKPEFLDANTYSLENYNEFNKVSNDYVQLFEKAARINKKLPVEYQDAFFQLVLHPVEACANLNAMYFFNSVNRHFYKYKSALVNSSADLVKQHYEKDSLITVKYHQLNNGKWNHMMDQTHIGYTYWQQPNRQRMPEVKYVPADSILLQDVKITTASKTSYSLIPATAKGNLFYEEEGYVSIEASHFTKSINSKGIMWKILPDHGRTADAITTFPVTAATQTLSVASPHLQYEFYSYSKDSVKIHLYFSPTLNFHASENGLQFAVSIDDEQPQLISLNKEDNTGVWNQWMTNNIIIKTTAHKITTPGKHTIKYWMVSPAVVLQKLVLDFGGVKQSYLGPPETLN